MSRIKCNIITPQIQQLAKDLKISDTLANVLVDIFQTETGYTRLPLVSEAAKLLKRESARKEELEAAIPYYTEVSREEGKYPKEGNVWVENGQVFLSRMESLEDFLGSLNDEASSFFFPEGIDDLRPIITTPSAAYKWMLWAAMDKIQYPDHSDTENMLAATEKAKKFIKSTPTTQSVQPQSSDIQEFSIEYTPKGKERQTYTIKKEGSTYTILNSKGKEVFKEDSVDRNKILANYLVATKQAVVVDYKDARYVVSKRGGIISVTSGKLMKWADNHASRRAIMDLAKDRLEALKGLQVDASPKVEETIKEQENNELPRVGIQVFDLTEDSINARMSRVFGPKRQDRISMIAHRFSEILNDIVNDVIETTKSDLAKAEERQDKEEVARLTQNLKTYEDDTNGRKAILREYGINNIFREMFEEYQEYSTMEASDLDENEERGNYLKSEYTKITDYFQYLLEDALTLVERLEDIRIVTETSNYHLSPNSEIELLNGQILDSSDKEELEEEVFGDDEEGNRVDANGGWSFKIRMTDPMPTSAEIRKLLSSVVKVDSKGNPEVDDLGNTRYLPGNYVYCILVNELSKSLTTSDDFAIKKKDGSYDLIALNKIAEKYPWMSQVISTMQTASPSLIAKMYSNFRLDFISYWLQEYDDEVGIKSIPLNQAVALESTMNQVISNYDTGTQLDEDTVYSTTKEISVEKAKKGTKLIDKTLPLFTEEDEIDTVVENTLKALKMLGFNVNENMLRSFTSDIEELAKLRQVNFLMKNIFSTVEKDNTKHLIDANKRDYLDIARIIGEVSEVDNVQSFYLDGKNIYSYSAPNYLDTLLRRLTSSEFSSVLDSEYKSYNWFFRNGDWLNEWCKLLESDENIRAQFATRDFKAIRVPTNTGSETLDYSKWTPQMIFENFILAYYSIPENSKSEHQFAWYASPILSDSSVCKMIKFKRYTGDFKSQLMPLFRNIVIQELHRIAQVEARREKGITPIANFDKHGLKFCFFPQLNSYISEEATEDGIKRLSFLEKCIEFKNAKNLTGLYDFIDNAMSEVMEKSFREFIADRYNLGSLEEILLKQGIKDEGRSIESYVEEFFWNNSFAQAQIIQLTTTDLAYYKDNNGVDFQKRFKEVYAAGHKLFTNSEYGKSHERVIYLADEISTSNAFSLIQDTLDRAVKEGHLNPKDRDIILKKFREVNATDAQAFRNLNSYRSILDMMGAWTDSMQETFDRIQAGEWSMADFYTVWQTLKPFVYTQISKPDGLGSNIKVPHQNKNSEFLLLAAYPFIASALRRSPKLRAMQNFMDKYGIDVIEYNSAVKVGCQLVVDLSYSPSKLKALLDKNNGELRNKIKDYKGSDYDKLKSYLDKQLSDKKITQEQYNEYFNSIAMSEDEVFRTLERSAVLSDGGFNPELVHEIPYDDYMIQQPTPEHLMDAESIFGSQTRNLLLSDLPDNFSVTVNNRTYDKKGIIELYQSLITENLLESAVTVNKRFQNIEILQQSLLEQVKGNSKYGREMIAALELVEITTPAGTKEKVFNIPVDSPSTTDKIQELMTAMFRNKITKQYIKGGNAILVSSVGLTHDLKLRRDKNGNLEGIECYLPASSRRFFEPFMVSRVDGRTGETYQELDIKALQKAGLDKAIGYRIPTEGKYSMMPLIIKGFLPQQNGSAIMVPADITTIAGSDKLDV